MEFFVIQTLIGLSYGLLLFMLSSGLTLIFSMMGVLNFAHASFYMLGAYVAYQIMTWVGYWPALVVAPLVVGVLGALVGELWPATRPPVRPCAGTAVHLRPDLHRLRIVQFIWGRAAVAYQIPASLDGPLFTIFSTAFPIYRGFMMLVALVMMASLWLLLTRTRIGLVIQAALTHPETVEALGHNVPRVFMLVFGGGAALAALAGVIGGNAFVTEPAMAGQVGSIIFVVTVVGGMGSLAGAFVASLLIGLLQTFAVSLDWSAASGLANFGITVPASNFAYPVLSLTLSQVAPVLPYLLLVLVLIFRPRGLMGTREG